MYQPSREGRRTHSRLVGLAPLSAMGHTAPAHAQLSIAAAPEVSVRKTFIHVTEAPPPPARTQSMLAGTVAVPADGIDVYQPMTGEEEDVLPLRCETLDRYEMPG